MFQVCWQQNRTTPSPPRRPCYPQYMVSQMFDLLFGLHFIIHISAKPVKAKGSGVEVCAEGPFLKQQNCGGEAAKALGE